MDTERKKTPSKSCKEMILLYLNHNATETCTASRINGGVKDMFEYGNEGALKRALKKMLDDQVLVNASGNGLNGSFKINPAHNLKKTGITKRVNAAKRQLKRVKSVGLITATGDEPATPSNTPRGDPQKDAFAMMMKKKPTSKNTNNDTTTAQKSAAKKKTATKSAKKNEPKLTKEEKALAKKLEKIESRPKKNYIRRQLYKDLLAIGAGDHLTKRSHKEKGYWGDGHSGNCFLSALTHGFYKIDPSKGKAELDRVIFEGGSCDNCDSPLKATIRHCLEQDDSGGCDYGSGPIMCSNENCDGYEDYGYYLTGLCQGTPSFDCGKFHNHCTRCKGLGCCIGDYRSAHCNWCGGHYFRGSFGGGHKGCPKNGNRFGGAAGFGGYRRRRNCVQM